MLAPSLSQFLVGPSGERGDLGVQGHDPLAQRLVGGQPGEQPLRTAQPACGQLVFHLLAQGPQLVRGGHGRRDQAGLILVQTGLAGLRGDDALDEAAACERAQPFDHLGQQQGVEFPRLACGRAQDGQDVLAGRLGRIGVRHGVHPVPRRGDRLVVQRPSVGQAEPAEHLETLPGRVAEDDGGGRPHAELRQMPGQVRLLSVRRGRQYGELPDDADPCLP